MITDNILLLLKGFDWLFKKIVHSFEFSPFNAEKTKVPLNLIDEIELHRGLFLCANAKYFEHTFWAVSLTHLQCQNAWLKLCSMPSSCNILTFQFVQTGAWLRRNSLVRHRTNLFPRNISSDEFTSLSRYLYSAHTWNETYDVCLWQNNIDSFILAEFCLQHFQSNKILSSHRLRGWNWTHV